MNTEALVEWHDEVWKPIPNYEGIYECSNYGRVRSLDRIRICKNGVSYKCKGKFIKSHIDKDGYLDCHFSYKGELRHWKISRLVAFLYVDGWDEKLDVNHIDFNKLNNYYKNLNYKTKEDNTKYSASAGRYNMNTSHFKHKQWRQKNITIQYDLNGCFVKEYESLKDAALSINGRKGMISRAIVGRSKTAYGFKWAYKK